MSTCYFRLIARSTSPEGEFMRNQHKYIPFGVCRDICDGHRNGCEFYEVRDRQPVVEENKVGRLEEIGAV